MEHRNFERGFEKVNRTPHLGRSSRCRPLRNKLGGIDRGTWDQGQGAANFNAFLDRMGSDYQAFRQKMNVYKIFRCGMAHEYGTKQPCVVEMIRGSAPSGLYDDGTKLHFNVEAYFMNFAAAAQALHQQVQSRPNAALPTIKLLTTALVH